MNDLKDRLLDAALPHVAFDGWSEATFRAAIEDAQVTPAQGRAACPRGALDLAFAFHSRGDDRMVAQIRGQDLSEMRFRDRVAHAVRTRIEIASENREAVRRGVTLFALPMHAADGLRALWGTSDAIWDVLGDTSDDVNWYTKRGTLSGVYSATVLYWLGDTSDGYRETWDFLDRRIDNVMQIEKVKGQVRKSPVLSRLMAGPNMILDRIKAPVRGARSDLPGHWRDPS
ncbi:ubiquinone biosynthesis protein COQ9 [Jannaschia faecimaris]|uniref:Ubiquinone biosynthesis protein COQ9 n=1 Tax=Jannaschia faecimaris TaxID=1244108 RepID=A0A1H3QUD2_9RHOB|nr:COQ9 family protein [Jannaschia faecimaris]SDZ16625.1 ubiquinone biosynthesis protein COQ9 [Jannaschia faecimaris]